MRVALAQIDTTVGDIWGNVEKMADALERATDSGADLIAYPELTIPGYPPEDLDGDLYNACAVVSGGGVLHRYHKRYLPNYSVFDENRYFREGEGAAVLKLDGTLAGVTVCEDM